MKWFVILLLAPALAVSAPTPRSSGARLQFMKATPCPATGKIQKSCPGYVVDHIIPLCAGGVDDPKTNMQWQKYKESLQKDVVERAMCRELNHKPFVL